MRLTLIDAVLLATGVIFINTVIAVMNMVGHYPGFLRLSVAFVATMFYIAFLSQIYKRFHFRPLFLPPCPHCRKIQTYTILGAGDFREHLKCSSCNGEFVADYGSSTSIPDTIAHLPVQKSQWPQLIGRWHLMMSGDK